MRLTSIKNALSSAKQSLSEAELRACIEKWLDGTPAEDGIFAFPIGDFNTSEGHGQVINRLYYAVPKCAPDGSVLDFFVFYEENIMDDDEEELTPVASRFFLWQAEDKIPGPCKY